jgi:hypothetical protein
MLAAQKGSILSHNFNKKLIKEEGRIAHQPEKIASM